MSKRIIDHDTDLTLRSDDYILKDSATNNTKKITPEAFVEEALDNYFAEYVSGLDSASASSDSDIFYTVVDGVQKKVSKSTILSADRTARATAEGTIASNFAQEYSTTTSYAVGDYCIKDLVLYKCTTATSGTWDSSKWTQVTALDLTSGVASDLADEIEARQSADTTMQGEIDELPVDVKVDGVSVVDTNNVAQINNKANTTGTYDDLVVGTAKNLLSDSFTENKVPYNFRQSFNGARLEDEIVGGTVAWNQLVKNGNFESTTNWTAFRSTLTVNNNIGTLTLGTAPVGSAQINQQVNIPSNHKLLLCGELNSSVAGNISIRTFKSSSGGETSDPITVNAQANTWTKYNVIRALNTDITKVFVIYAVASENSTLQLKNIQIIDLTQMFGSTIADYIYSLEQATASAGVAYFRNLFPKSYYAYNSGALMSVNASSHNTVGKNLAEKVIHGYIRYQDGKVVIDNDSESVVFYAIEGKTYVVSSSVEMVRSIVGLANTDNITNQYQLLQMTELANNVHVWTATWTGWTVWYKCPGASSGFANSVQVEFGSTATTYESYTKHTYQLDSNLTLRGIPKLDSSNNLYYDGDIYKSDGGVTRRFGVVDLGSLTWGVANGRFYSQVPVKVYALDDLANIKCPRYLTVKYNAQINGFCSSYAGYIYVMDDTYSSPSDFKTAMNGVYLVYELATPTSETADAFINPQIVDARGTEEYVDYAESQGTRDVAIPVGHNSKYFADLKSKIENIPDVPSANGTYTLKATRSASGVTFAWVSG